ncbi:MAG: (deoxy)nucleoside triphosphate pyrophosphohydrolase [Bdellovibrionales bacterium]|nr:(deoxy)nucleoside triphosphate pyrophosphohydrolase [Bdellovibrionales bacterium]
MSNHPLVQVVAAILETDGRILIARRRVHKSNGGLWEFPGGRVEEGESRQEALVRELLEELGLAIHVKEQFLHSSHSSERNRIELYTYRAWLQGGQLSSVDHDALAWVAASELKSFAFTPADLPVVARLSNC